MKVKRVYNVPGGHQSAEFGSTHSTSALSTVIGVCVGSAFFILLVAAATCYFYRKRSIQNHKTLLLKSQPQKILTFKKPTAVRSPTGSGFLKKSPSPTGSKSPPSCEKPISTNLQNEFEEVAVTIKGNEEIDVNECKNLVNVQENEINKERTFLGKLHFKLKYNYEKKALCVSIIKCTDLPPKDPTVGSCDPYVKLQLLPDKQHKVKTRVLRKTQNPVFDEDFTFFGISPNQLQVMTLHFVILSFDRYSRDEVIGETFCQLNLLTFDTLEKQIFMNMDISPRNHKLKVQNRGEILVSLCYQPAANRLTAVVLKARNLPKMDITGFCDPFVKIYLMHQNQRIAKKRTHIKKRTTSPVFNESFVFDVSYKEGLENVNLEFHVLDYDRMTKNEVIGKLVLGPSGNSSAQKHWRDVVASPRRQIAEWHKLAC